MSVPCPTCGELPQRCYAWQKYGWPDQDTHLPDAVERLELVRDLGPGGSRLRQVQRCPGCGAHFLYETDYEYLVNGTEDEQTLTRLTLEQAKALLRR
ncbi:MAG: hypothetical protein ABIO70_30520 [Pseudomonadota bacterium]